MQLDDPRVAKACIALAVACWLASAVWIVGMQGVVTSAKVLPAWWITDPGVVDTDGTGWVVHRGAVVRIGPDGRIAEQWPVTLSRGAGFARDTDGTLAVVDLGRAVGRRTGDGFTLASGPMDGLTHLPVWERKGGRPVLDQPVWVGLARPQSPIVVAIGGLVLFGLGFVRLAGGRA